MNHGLLDPLLILSILLIGKKNWKKLMSIKKKFLPASRLR